MMCPKCGKDTVKQVITTRLYREGGFILPVIVNRYACTSCQWFDLCDSHKRHFCKVCGNLTGSRTETCGPCQGYNKGKVFNGAASYPAHCRGVKTHK